MTAKEIKELSKDLVVLYAEDENEVQEQTAIFFGNFFKRVDKAKNGKEGLELFSKNSYDVVITDIKMPFVSGVQMLNKIREINPDVITVSMTGLSGGDVRNEAVSDFYIVKPANTQTLMELMEKIVKTKR